MEFGQQVFEAIEAYRQSLGEDEQVLDEEAM